MKVTDWSSDFHARQVYREIERALGPVLARMMPGYNLTSVGIVRREGEFDPRPTRRVELRLHLELNGKPMPPERDPMDGFDDGALQVLPGADSRTVGRIKP